MRPEALLTLENEHLRVTVNDDASADLLDATTGTAWHMGRTVPQEEGPVEAGHVWLRTFRTLPEQYPGYFTGQVVGDGRVRFTVLGRRRAPVGSFTCEFRLDGRWLQVRLLDLDDNLPSLVFPTPIESDSLVVPKGAGRWIREPLDGRFLWPYGGAGINMRWFGGLRGDHGWLAVLDEGHADAGVFAGGMWAAPAWWRSLGTWRGARSVRYRFTGGGYVGLAKAFRAWAAGRGLVRTLDEKLAAVPAVGNLLGGRVLSFMQAEPRRVERFEARMQPVPEEIAARAGEVQVNHTHADVARLVAKARAAGMRRGLVAVRGWIAGGYDESHPDVWPPEPALGPVEELRALTTMGGQLVSALHDNYTDIYEQSPSFPHGVVRNADGSPMPAGVWDGGQAYVVNARDAVAYARRNWARIGAELAPGAMFADTTTAMQLYQSYEPGNATTRADDERHKTELLAFFKDQGLVLGSEEGMDFGMPHVDWLENRHRRVAGESVPLWSLVFHDAAFCTRYVGSAVLEPDGVPPWLTDLLWGYLLLWDLRGAPELPAGFGDTFHVDAWHERVGAAELVDHRYLTEDGEVERTEFGTGDAVIVNFAAEERSVDGVTVPARGYRIL